MVHPCAFIRKLMVSNHSPQTPNDLATPPLTAFVLTVSKSESTQMIKLSNGCRLQILISFPVTNSRVLMSLILLPWHWNLGTDGSTQQIIPAESPDLRAL